MTLLRWRNITFSTSFRNYTYHFIHKWKSSFFSPQILASNVYFETYNEYIRTAIKVLIKLWADRKWDAIKQMLNKNWFEESAWTSRTSLNRKIYVFYTTSVSNCTTQFRFRDCFVLIMRFVFTKFYGNRSNWNSYFPLCCVTKEA